MPSLRETKPPVVTDVILGQSPKPNKNSSNLTPAAVTLHSVSNSPSTEQSFVRLSESVEQ